MPTSFPDLFQSLCNPFRKEEIKVRKQAGRDLQYVTARTVMNRLDEVLGPENWWDEYQDIGDTSAICRLTICLPDGSVITKCDAGGAAGMQDAGDDDKSILSDAFKRAAVKFGVGRHLYRDGVPSFGDVGWKKGPGPGKDPEVIPDSHSGLPPDCPVNGRVLFGRLKQAEQADGRPLVKIVSDQAAKIGIKGRMVDWTPAQIRWAWDFLHRELTTADLIGETIPSLRMRLYDTVREAVRIYMGPEFDKLDEDARKREVKKQINEYLNSISPGEVIESLADLKDKAQIDKLIGLGQRTLDALNHDPSQDGVI